MNKGNKTGVLRSDPNYLKEYRRTHPNVQKDADKRYIENHPDKYQDKIDRNTKRMREYRKTHPESRIRENYGDEAAEFWLLHYQEGCKKCGKKTTLHLHHIDNNEENNKSENLVILCREHHIEVHRYYNEEDRWILVKWFKNWMDKSPQSLNRTVTDWYLQEALK